MTSSYVSVSQWISVPLWWTHCQQLLTTETRRTHRGTEVSFNFRLRRPLHHRHLHRFHTRSHRRSNNLIALLRLTCRDSHGQAEAFSIEMHCQMMS
jgi:hypothetical protein